MLADHVDRVKAPPSVRSRRRWRAGFLRCRPRTEAVQDLTKARSALLTITIWDGGVGPPTVALNTTVNPDSGRDDGERVDVADDERHKSLEMPPPGARFDTA